MGPQDETEGCGQGQTDWADSTLTGKPADRCVSGGSMYFANGSLGGRASQFTHDSTTTSRRIAVDVRKLVWDFFKYKCRPLDTPKFERWQAASRLIISHLQLPLIIAQLPYQPASRHHKTIRASVLVYQLSLSLSECNLPPRSCWHLLSSATPCLPPLSQTPSRKSCPQEEETHPRHRQVTTPCSIPSENIHLRKQMCQDIPARKSLRPSLAPCAAKRAHGS